MLRRIRIRARKITERAVGRKPAAAARSRLLSLVLVAEHDEDALLRTVTALLAQDEHDLEIIVMVPHGAAPPALVAMEGEDQRLFLLPGTGRLEDAVNASAGAFLAFVEPGAVPDPGLHRRLAAALEESAADFVAAVPASASSPAGRSIARLLETQREGFTLLTRPDALADTETWTKLYRRAFVEPMIGHTSGGDTEPLALRGYLQAGGFDYVVTPTGAPPAMPEAVTVHEELLQLGERARRVTDLVCGEGQEEALSAWFGAALGTEWLRFSKEVPRQEESYWKLVVAVAAHVSRTPGALDRFPVHSRILVFLAAGGSLEDFRTVLAALQDCGTGYRLGTNSGGSVEEIPGYLPLVSLPLPAGLLRLRREPTVRSGLSLFGWKGETLQLGGFAYVEGLDAEKEPVKLNLWLVEPSTGTRLPLPVVRHHRPAIDEASGDQLNSYAGAGFSAELDAPTVLAAMEGTRTNEWYLELELSALGMVVRDRLASRDADRVPSRLPIGPVVGSRRLCALFDGVLGLRFTAVSYRYLADPPALNGTTVSVTFRGEAPDGVVLDVPGVACLPFEASDPATFTLSVPPEATPSLSGGELTGQIRAGKPGSLQHVGTAAGTGELEPLAGPGERIRAAATGFGFLTLTLGPARITVSGWRTEGSAVVVVLHGSAGSLQQPGDLALAGPETVVADALRAGVNGQTEAVFELSRDRWGAGASLPGFGHYRLVSRGSGRGHTDPVVVTGALTGVRAEADMARLRIVSPARSHGQAFQLQLLSSLKSGERGRYNRRRLIETYWGSSSPLDESAVLFETFGGITASDSGLAISQALAGYRPELKRFWSVADASTPVPEGCVPLQRFSTDWFRVLGTAKYLVNNNDFPVFFRKREGQVYVQTWHGTPLKRVGLDTPHQRLTPSYLRTLEREPGEWDMLLAQSPIAGERLAAAFRYSGRVAVLGYPRNDPLSSPAASSVRASVRERLGIPPQNTVVLYAPTWRDTAVDRSGRVQAVSYLNGSEALAHLGPGYSLLYRGHHKVSGRQGNSVRGMTDVTGYPHVSGLCLAADVLVTDYSSIMFDFAVTGKPMFFLAPDFAQYRDRTRGFYFDLEEEAPGPIAENSAELFEQIRTYAPGQWAGKYRNFVETYAPLDDGGAAFRVCRAVFGDD